MRSTQEQQKQTAPHPTEFGWGIPDLPSEPIPLINENCTSEMWRQTRISLCAEKASGERLAQCPLRPEQRRRITGNDSELEVRCDPTDSPLGSHADSPLSGFVPLQMLL